MESRFIGEVITVEFDKPPMLAKKPGCPDRLVWHGETFEIIEKLAEWHDYDRRGRMTMNMRPSNMAKAARRGSWGVGRFYFRVQVADGRIFEFYYDRAPKDASRGSGEWFLTRQLLQDESNNS